MACLQLINYTLNYQPLDFTWKAVAGVGLTYICISWTPLGGASDQVNTVIRFWVSICHSFDTIYILYPYRVKNDDGHVIMIAVNASLEIGQVKYVRLYYTPCQIINS